ncbi:hypothetical protein A4A49_41443 [Nicotiana attenuata]|uniref:Uncharacterized protein n=1 Tax=Nicotiana attenuata TaxID=49451 RepID=A0A1J6KCD0_NICAT|nr:hypothetical protein A4A49_41443 [Nicotiana attenuata]
MDIANRQNSTPLCSAHIKNCGHVSSSNSQALYPNTMPDQNLRCGLWTSNVQTDRLMPDLNVLPLLQDFVDPTTIRGSAFEKGKIKQPLTDKTSPQNSTRLFSTPIKNCGHVSSSRCQGQYPNSMPEQNWRYGLSNSNVQTDHLLPDLNEPPLLQEFEDVDIDGDIPGKVDVSVNQTKGPRTFRLSGQNYHQIGSLLPPQGSTPKFAQLYIYDTENEVENRIHAISYCESNNQLHAEIVTDLKQMPDDHNVLAKSLEW